jgi:hypothetical protein
MPRMLCCMQAPTVGINGAASVEQVRIAVLGASGYTGEEVVRLLALHPNFSVAALTGESQAGKVRECSVITHPKFKGSQNCCLAPYCLRRLFLSLVTYTGVPAHTGAALPTADTFYK